MTTKTAMMKLSLTLSTLLMATACGSDPAGDPIDEDTSGTGSTGSGTQSCPSAISGTSGTKITMKVTWPDTIGVVGGSDEIVVWTRSELTFDGNDVTGEVQACGSVVPPLQTKEAFGGQMIQPVIPDELWDSGTVPTTQARGTISGFDPGATISMEPAGAILGATMNDPMNDDWPASWQGLELVDADGSGQPGVTAFPNDTDGYAMPPLDIFPDGDKAEALYLATRSVFELEGTRDTCTSASGNVVVHAFDNHVVGCRVAGGGECDTMQVDFVDSNRTIYEITGATYEMVQVDDGASCDDVRAALP
jgi:hypothetical protein